MRFCDIMWFWFFLNSAAVKFEHHTGNWFVAENKTQWQQQKREKDAGELLVGYLLVYILQPIASDHMYVCAKPFKLNSLFHMMQMCMMLN